MSDELLARLSAFTAPDYTMERVGLDAVNEPMIRHWCEAMGDDNPIYTDDEAARAAGHPGIVAPPQMIGAWVMRPIEPPPSPPNDGRRALMAALDEAGYTSVVATGTEQTYERYLRPGDRVRARIEVESVTGLKTTGLGEGYFFTTRSEYVDQDDAVVAVERFHLLKFKPAPRAQTTAQRPRASRNADTAFYWEGLQAGTLLIQRCASCGTLRHPPRPGCAACRSLDWDTVEAAGTGEVYSYTVHHHPPMPGFAMPYVVGLIELNEGVRLLANIVDVPPDDVAIGMRVRARIEHLDDELSLPMFSRESG
jgi:uncharacterized OB-fold protein/acyl dehydratase